MSGLSWFSWGVIVILFFACGMFYHLEALLLIGGLLILQVLFAKS
jgi:hypothetical protein